MIVDDPLTLPMSIQSVPLQPTGQPGSWEANNDDKSSEPRMHQTLSCYL